MRNIIAIALLASLGACSTSQLASPVGQVFCAIQTQGGGQIVVGLVDATATAETGAAAPIVAVGAAATQTALNAQCAKAAAVVPSAIGSTGAVPAPAMPVQTVAVAPISVPATPPPAP